MKTLISRARGFTLIELLIVIAIIAILSGIIITNLAGSRAKSRDGARVSDIAQIQLALEQYFDRCQQYPASLATTQSAGCPIDSKGHQITLADFISKIPTPPSAATYDYAPYTAVGGSIVTDYVLHTQLETLAVALNDSLTSGTPPTTPDWFTNTHPYTCYIPNTKNGQGLYDYCIGTR